MRARDIERFLASTGFGAAKMDAVMRRLRAIDRLPVGAPGKNAPVLNPHEIASVLIAAAGSAKGVAADQRLAKLEQLENGAGEKLIDMIVKIIEGDEFMTSSVREVRIGRNVRSATIVCGWADKYQTFQPKQIKSFSGRFQVHGVFDRKVLSKIRLMYQLQDSFPYIVENDEPDDDA